MRHRLLILLSTLAVLLTATSVALAASPTVVTVDHGPIVLTYLDDGAPGTGVGDRRLGAIGITAPGGDRRIGSLQAELVTTQSQRPAAGKEIRIGTLIFTIGNLSNQIVVQGIAVYALTAPTIATSSSTDHGRQRPLSRCDGLVREHAPEGRLVEARVPSAQVLRPLARDCA